MIFFDTFENRIAAWVKLRQELETHPDPFNYAIKFWNRAPIGKMTCDPFDRSTWLGAWDLIDENKYCEFSKMLALSYTFLLTDRFNAPHQLKIAADRENHEMLYLLHIGDQVLGYNNNSAMHEKEIPSHLVIQAAYMMSPDQM